MDETKVIQFKPESFKYRKTANREQISCDHINVIVDEETRTIECGKCGIVLDPFDYLKDVCYKENHAFDKYGLLLKEVERLDKRYKNLTKEIERLNKIRKT